MDNKHDILALLRGVANGTTSPEDALLKLKEAPFEDLGYAKVDFHRSVRQGAAEVIYGAGKTPEQISGVARTMGARGCRNILVTRISQETADLVDQSVPLDYHPEARLGLAYPGEQKRLGNIVVATGGTSDMPVAEEAALTGEGLPVAKRPGGAVYAGTVVEEGRCVVEVRQSAGQGRYDQIVEMIIQEVDRRRAQ